MVKHATRGHCFRPAACAHLESGGVRNTKNFHTLQRVQAELAAVMLANRAAIVPLIPKVLADLPAQAEAAAHREACAACVRDYHMVRIMHVLRTATATTEVAL